MEYDVLIVGGGPAGKSPFESSQASFLISVDARSRLGYPLALAVRVA